MAEFINQTVNTVVTGGLVLEASNDHWHRMTMMEVVAEILANKSTPEALSKASLALGKNATEFAYELNAVLIEQPHGGNFSKSMYITGLVLSIVTSMTVGLRLASRKFLGISLKLEDYLIIIALFMALVFASLMQHSTLYGGGTHIWDVSYYNVYWVTRCLFICEFMYTGSIIAVKSSLLIFFYRLTPQRSYRVAVLSVAVFVGLMSVAMAFAMTFQCKPIAWYKDVLGRKCFNELAFWTAFGALCIISDIFILLLPIPVVWNLQLRLKDKIGVTALFSLGAIVCVASGLRLRTLEGFVKSVDFTSREGAFGLWCVVELDTAIICASIPACKGLFTRCTSRKNESGYYGRPSRISRSRNTGKVINTFNSSAPTTDKNVTSHGQADDHTAVESVSRRERKNVFVVGEEDEIPLDDVKLERERAMSNVTGPGVSAEDITAHEQPLPKPLQVPGVYYGSQQRASASTLGDDLEAQRTQTQDDIAFVGLTPRNST